MRELGIGRSGRTEHRVQEEDISVCDVWRELFESERQVEEREGAGFSCGWKDEEGCTRPLSRIVLVGLSLRPAGIYS